jgi:hypothetical protein
MTPIIFQLLFYAILAVNPEFSWLPVPQIVAQAMLETGNFKSNICLSNKNLFGMKHPMLRKTVSLGVRNGHAYYASYLDCIRDYFMWLKGLNLTTLDKYQHFISNVYATDPNYRGKIESKKKDLAGSLIDPSLFFLLAAGIFFFIQRVIFKRGKQY